MPTPRAPAHPAFPNPLPTAVMDSHAVALSTLHVYCTARQPPSVYTRVNPTLYIYRMARTPVITRSSLLKKALAHRLSLHTACLLYCTARWSLALSGLTRYKYIYMYICIYVNVYVCVCVYIYIYIYPRMTVISSWSLSFFCQVAAGTPWPSAPGRRPRLFARKSARVSTPRRRSGLTLQAN